MKNILVFLTGAILFLNQPCIAQCGLKTIKTSKGKQIETPEGIYYTRSTKQYNALAIKVYKMLQNSNSGFKLHVSYSATRIAGIKSLTLVGTDSASVTLPLVFTGQKKTDNPLISTQIYHTALSSNALAFISSHKLKTMVVTTAALGKQISIGVDDATFLMNYVQCLNSMSSN